MYGGLTEWCDGSTAVVGSKTAASSIPVVGSIFDLLGTTWEKQMAVGYGADILGILK